MSKTINLGKVKGEDATINGVNALTLTTDSSTGIDGFQSGNTYTLALNPDTTPTANSSKPVTSGGVKTALDTKLDSSQKGAASGLAELDANGKVPSSQLPSYVDDVIEGYYKEADGKFYKESTYETEIVGESSKIYLSLDTNLTYRWTGSAFVKVASDLALGETPSTAYRGDRGKAAYEHSQMNSGNPHGVTKSDVGLSNVVNTGDTATPTQNSTEKFTAGGAYTELNKKQDKNLSSPITVDGTPQTTVEGALSAINNKEAGINVSGNTTQFLGWDTNGDPVAKNYSEIANYDVLESIAVTTAPTKTAYKVGETFDATGMVVTGTYRIAGTAAVTGYTVSPTVMSFGTISVTITYTEDGVTKTTSQAVTVTKNQLAVPSQNGSVQADGVNPKSPTWSNYDTSKLEIVSSGSTTSSVAAGTFDVIFKIRDTDTYCWSDGTTANKTVQWTLDPMYELYGFELKQSESSPGNMISYLGNCDNASYRAAQLTGDNTFSYGDWADAWFIKDIKVVLMAYNGTISKELNKNNYAKDTSGNTVDISSAAAGNVMVGIPKVYIKVDTSGTNPKFYFSNHQIDSDYKCYAHTDVNGNEIDYTYMAAYDGYYDGTRQRSVSGVSPTRNTTGTDEINRCRANNTQGGVTDVWDMGTFGDRNLITLLLMLIGKNCDTATQFGYGNDNGYSSHATGSDTNGVVNTGTLNDKGLFAGYKSVHNLAVKVFGIENFWGNIWKRTQGLLNDKGTYKVKLCRSNIDGTTSTDYSTAGTGYLSAGSSPSSSNYISSMAVNAKGFMLTSAVSGSDSTYYCDYYYTNNSQTNFAFFGGDSIYGLQVGAFALVLNNLVSSSSWHIGASLSAKPKAA